MCGTLLSSSILCTFALILNRPSLSPQATYSSRSCLAAFAWSLMRVAGDLVFGAEEKPPTQAKVSRLFSPKLSAWPPPIDRPASARLTVGLYRIVRLDVGNHVLEQILFKRAEILKGVAALASLAWWPARRAPVGHHDQHGDGLLLGAEVVQDDVRHAAPGPLVVVAADAVQQVEDRVLVVPGIPRRRVDGHLALAAADLRVVLDGLHLAAVDAVAADVEALGGRGDALPGRRVLAVGGAAQGQHDGTGGRQQWVSHGVLSSTKPTS